MAGDKQFEALPQNPTPSMGPWIQILGLPIKRSRVDRLIVDVKISVWFSKDKFVKLQAPSIKLVPSPVTPVDSRFRPPGGKNFYDMALRPELIDGLYSFREWDRSGIVRGELATQSPIEIETINRHFVSLLL